jgi:polyvinyl alcohol dehydrogenase (cytochrome)
MAVTVTTAPSVTAGTPEELFRLDDTLVLSDAARSLAAEVESLTPMAEVAAIQPTQEIHDVVVVGSGAGGGTVAHVLTGLGLRVTLLEAGPMLDPMRDFKEHQWPHDYDHRGAEVGGRRYFGRGEAFGFFSTTSGGWELEGEPYTVGDDSEFQWFRSRIIGGRTNHYGRLTFRFSDYDFKPFDRDGLGVNWPIGYDDIAPYYDKAETLIGVTGSHEGIRSAPDGVFLDPPQPKAHELLIRAASQRLGIPCIPNRRSVLTRPLNGRPACHYRGQCGRGCLSASNYSSSQVQIFPALETGRLQIIDQAMAREIATDGNGKATDLIYIDKRTRQEQRLRCRVLVLAASACESARILLNSKTSEFPNGVANSSGVVGRYLMDTVGYGLSGRIPSFEGMPRYNSDGAGGAAAQTARSGEQIYTQICVRCHENMVPILTQAPIQEYPADRIYEALNFGFMVRQAAGLTQDEKRAVAEYVSSSPAGSLTPPLDQIPQSAYCSAGGGPTGDPLAGQTWNGWSPDHDNARFQTVAAAGVTAAEVPNLSLKWAFGFPGVSVASLQASIAGGQALVGTSVGLVYALDADTGCIRWVTEADVGVRSAISVGSDADGRATAYFGDLAGTVYGVDFATGEQRWKVKVDEHPDARITGAPALHEGRLYVPVASFEEGTAAVATYQCCTFRGSIVALDASTGRELWKTYPITDEPRRTDTTSTGVQRWGPSGAGIWAAPTLDPDRNVMYVATGDSYSQPVDPGSDALMAVAMDTGRVLWTTQTFPGDAWTVACMAEDPAVRANCPDDAGPDVDFGSAMILTTRADGRRVLLAGQKSGVMYALDPENGEILWESRVANGGVLGGIEWGFATDGTAVFASTSDAFEEAPGEAGGLTSLQVADGEVVWHAPPVQDTCGTRVGCHTAQPGAVTAIPGVVFSGSLDGHIRAYATDTGNVIWDADTVGEYDTVNGVPGLGGALNGPGATIAGGMLYVSSGYSSFGFMAGNVLLAFSVDGQ